MYSDESAKERISTAGNDSRNHPAQAQDAGALYPDLVYSNHLDAFFPCRIIASGGGMVFIEALYHGQAVQMRVPSGIVYRRPAASGELRGLEGSR